jgi:hypothetical protein
VEIVMLPDTLFVAAAPIERQVEIGGVTHTLYFRELPAVEWIRYHELAREGGEDQRFGALAHLISISLCDASGAPVLPRDRAMQLKAAALNALFAAVLDINGGASEKKS